MVRWQLGLTAFLPFVPPAAAARAQAPRDVAVRVAIDTTWIEGSIAATDTVDQVLVSLTLGGGGERAAIGIRRDGRIERHWYPSPELGTATLPWQNRAFAARSAIPLRGAAGQIVVRSTVDSLLWRFVVGLPATATSGLEGHGTRTATVTLVRGATRTRHWSAPLPRTTALPSVAVAPMVVGTVRQQRSGLIGTSTFQELGGTVRVGPVEGVELVATATPRFAEVEPDEQRINLTRYRLFLPDRRTELAGLNTEFDPVPGSDLALFHSRRIGFDSLGLPVPIVAHGVLRAEPLGIRLSAFGLLTEETRNQRSQMYAAIRARKQFGALAVGGLAIQRSAPDAPFLDRNRTFAAEGALGLGRGWVLEGWSALTQSPRLIGGDQAYSVGVKHDGSRVRHLTRFTQLGEFFNPEVGFLTDRGYRRYETDLAIDVGTLGLPAVTQLVARGGFAGNFRLLDRFHLTSTIDGGVGVRLGAGVIIETSIARRHEGFLAPFDIAPSVTLPRGHYRWTEAGFGVRAGGERWRADARVDVGGLYNGSQLGGGLSVDWRPTSWIGLAVLTDLSRIRLDQGSFDRILIGSRLSVGPGLGPRIEALVQYNNSVRLWTGNARLLWLDRRGTGLVIAFNDAHEADRPWRWVRPQVRSVAVQLSKQIGVGRSTSRW